MPNETRLNDGENLEIADPADFEVQRDDDGELLPVKQRIPGTDKAVLVRPLTPGELAEYDGVLDGTDEDSEKQAELLRNHIVEGPGADATADYVEHTLRGYVLGGLLRAIRNSSGYDVHLGNQKQEMNEMQDQIGLLDDVDPETVRNLSEVGQQLTDDS